MTIAKKEMDLPEGYASTQQWAESQKCVFMNMLNGVSFNTVDSKYYMMPIQYSDVNMEGEKIRFADGREFTVIYSCLASEYAHKQEVKDEWWSKARELIDGFKQAQQMDDYIASNNNVDLNKLRNQGSLDDDINV